jgi:hypothetical protein
MDKPIKPIKPYPPSKPRTKPLGYTVSYKAVWSAEQEKKTTVESIIVKLQQIKEKYSNEEIVFWGGVVYIVKKKYKSKKQIALEQADYAHDIRVYKEHASDYRKVLKEYKSRLAQYEKDLAAYQVYAIQKQMHELRDQAKKLKIKID